MRSKLHILLLLFVISCSHLKAKSQDDSLKTKLHFELSFGQSLLFISNSRLVDIRKERAIVVPTSAILFLVQFRPDRFMRIPVFLNIATETKQFLVNGQLVNERAAPTLGAGVVFKVVGFKVDKKSKVEIESGILLSALFNRHNEITVAPVAAARVRLLRGENFVMYAGVSYSLGVNAMGMLYGTGTLF